jgi:fatty acid desaturase
MERDEVFVPKTRKEIGIPLEHEDNHIDYSEYFNDSPIYNLLLLVRQQLIGWPSYLLFNASGQRHYPAGSSHFNPESKFFRKSQARLVRISTLGICVMSITVLIACMQYGASQVWRLYGIPWMLVSHWIVMITYLQHTDPRVPHYRGEAWNFQRGAAATVDRESFLGWQGHFFLHDVAKHHTAHRQSSSVTYKIVMRRSDSVLQTSFPRCPGVRYDIYIYLIRGMI